jgi:hypothetical protein
MDIRESTRDYEAWLRARMPVIAADLRAKHEAMASAAFPFLRATFYRWAEVWPDECAALARAPRVLAVGDLHVENFGTWRDDEGRLVWGINDFDEACSMPYTNDLVRLATSAVLAIREDRLACAPTRACDAVLEGYSRALKAPSRPFILSERNRWLRGLALNEVRDPKRFWKKVAAAAPARGAVPTLVLRAIEEDLPDPVVERRMLHRRAGLGSLGRRRYTLLCRRNGAWIAREAKELTESAWRRRAGGRGTASIQYEKVCRRAVRAEDPFVRIRGNWVVRRLSPDCSRIELRDLPREHDWLRLLRAMGAETANIHRGTEDAHKDVLADLERRPRKWLRVAASAMAQSVTNDWRDWRRFTRTGR